VFIRSSLEAFAPSGLTLDVNLEPSPAQLPFTITPQSDHRTSLGGTKRASMKDTQGPHVHCSLHLSIVLLTPRYDDFDSIQLSRFVLREYRLWPRSNRKNVQKPCKYRRLQEIKRHALKPNCSGSERHVTTRVLVPRCPRLPSIRPTQFTMASPDGGTENCTKSGKHDAQSISMISL
jgi:hypothetical protein